MRTTDSTTTSRTPRSAPSAAVLKSRAAVNPPPLHPIGSQPATNTKKPGTLRPGTLRPGTVKPATAAPVARKPPTSMPPKAPAKTNTPAAPPVTPRLAGYRAPAKTNAPASTTRSPPRAPLAKAPASTAGSTVGSRRSSAAGTPAKAPSTVSTPRVMKNPRLSETQRPPSSASVRTDFSAASKGPRLAPRLAQLPSASARPVLPTYLTSLRSPESVIGEEYEPYERPPSVGSMRSGLSRLSALPGLRGPPSLFGDSHIERGLPKFFHADDIQRKPNLSAAAGPPKFFYADDIKGSGHSSIDQIDGSTTSSGPRLAGSTTSSGPRKAGSTVSSVGPYKAGSTVSSNGPYVRSSMTNVPHLGPTTHLTPRLATSPIGHHSPMNSSPSASTASSEVSRSYAAPSAGTRNVKFVYANGEEEVIETRTGLAALDISDDSSRPASPVSALMSPGYMPSSASSIGKSFASPRSSAGPLSPTAALMASPLPRVPASPDRAFGANHGRGLSIGTNGASQEIFLAPAAVRSPGSIAGVNSTFNMTQKLREELAANARRERKVMDLEISNGSLLALNRTLEKRMRKQNSELRRYRRLTRTGQLVPKSPTKRGGLKGSLSKEDHGDGVEDGERGMLEKLGMDEDYEEEEEEEEEDDEDSLWSGDESDPDKVDDGTTKPSYKGRRAIVTADKDKVSAELLKHQAVLEASAKTNASLKRCMLMVEELMKDATKALEYKVAPSDVKLGGRILGSDNEEDDDDEEREDTGIDLDAPAGMSETEAEEEDMSEGEDVDDGSDVELSEGYHGDFSGSDGEEAG